MSGIDMGKTIEKIIGKIKKEKTEKEEQEKEPSSLASSTPSIPNVVYLKALSLHSLEELDAIKNDVKSGNILIIRISLLAEKNIDDVKRAVGELSEFIGLIGGDIARLGEERIVVTPPFVKIWKEKPAVPESKEVTEA
ncbi:MAG: cell division protein SepF [Candidatus Bathyarchaeia archaeon]